MARTQRPTHLARLVADNGSSSVRGNGPPSGSIVAPTGASPIRSSKRAGEADSKTPIKPSSSRTSAAQSNTSHASHSRSRQSRPAAPEPTTQRDMDIYIESEMRDAIFHDRKFVENFLTGDQTKLDTVLEHCRTSEFYNSESKEWILPEITSEASMYGPLLGIFNTIKTGVHNANPSPSSGVDGEEQPAPVMFQDCSSHSIRSDEAETMGLKPDLVLFESTHEHWETVRMPVEIKKLTTHHKAGMKQLSRYARAVFAHQLHRRHLYGMMVCGMEATFVRFDRAGILYSPRIDLRNDAEGFTKAFASLLMLDRADEGYDPAFTTRLNNDGRLEYVIELPGSALGDTTVGIDSIAGPSNGDKQESKRKFKVIETLCHRKSICGRATIVLRIREDIPQEATTTNASNGKRKLADREDQVPAEYVLKLIWRDPKRESEGEVLERLQGMFGLAQYVWHCDVPGRSSTGVDETAQVGELAVCDNLKDIAISVPLEDGSGELPELVQVDTTRCRPTSFKRKRRIYSYILMSSLGEPLWTAQSPEQFMTAILDAILGYWQLVNLGILHRDISDGNVMMLSTLRKSGEGSWKKAGETSVLEDEAFVESEKRLREVLDKLDRPPTGMLSDFDLHTTHSRPPPSKSMAPTGLPEQTINAPITRTSASRSHTSGTAAGFNEPSSKRRKTNSSMGVPTPTTPSHTGTPTTRRSFQPSMARPEHPSQARDEIRTTIDFRTGTPAFMSLRVLKVRPGNEYYHSYLDDLESFFWLIFWSAAAHVRPGRRPTQSAQEVLNSMDDSNLKAIASWKSAKLAECVCAGGADIIELFAAFQNDWAEDRMFVSVILELGTFFFDCYYNPEASRAPADVFSKVIGIIQHALPSVD